MTQPVFRFAPSPNGELHLGHAYSALLNARMAAAVGGRLLLRIEDIDVTRCTPAFEQAIYRDLAWLGIVWEEPVRRQSDHFADYARSLDALVDAGLAYPSFMSRGEARAMIAEAEADGRDWPRDPDGVPLFPTVERRLPERERRRRIAAGEPYAWRLDLGAALAHVGGPLHWDEEGAGPAGETGRIAADPAAWGDVVIARKEVPTSYHLSVTLDDALQGVTHVVRGRDLYFATAVQRLLQELLGLPQPVYVHHDLILGDDGRKLSKSRHDTGLAALRAADLTPADIARMVGL
ncbi:MAG: tRNA glutamyl-Q(34) synthetase GluQRS [Aquamicrobium sp.]|uniref:tRNA glutamyl-Q(34) synthetase GluQRS n=1 Tax=Aquamicrobium sp. TaxID=1872579 RepID=UPI00349EE531|nr:tRNA glutamyl-Q(34) synthetase GluQRS [Aquamicrobium sp.]